MHSQTKTILRVLISALFCILAFTSNSASAFVYLTGSLSADTSNADYRVTNERSVSGTIAFDLGRFIRLGYTHKQQYQTSRGWEEVIDANTGEVVFVSAEDWMHVTANSIDLTLILYEGDVFVPYISGGGVVKAYEIETHRGGELTRKTDKPIYIGPMPNLGAGLAIRLNREFSLKITYLTSPGSYTVPGEKSQTIWDKTTSVGLQYQL